MSKQEAVLTFMLPQEQAGFEDARRGTQFHGAIVELRKWLTQAATEFRMSSEHERSAYTASLRKLDELYNAAKG